jgi:hypothetical protein
VRRLVHDPKPEILRIEELVRRVKEGDIRLPRFQRPYVWKQSDIIDLLDSVYYGYPIGSVLLWRTTQKLASERSIGDLDVDERPVEYPTNYLLDGQQRISTLCGVLYWNGLDKRSKWNVAFNLRTETFFYPTEDLREWELPLNKLLNTFDFLNCVRRLETLQDRQEVNSVAERLLSAVKDYKIAAVVLGDMRLNEVAPIFERINSTGRRLTIVDLMRAATWSGEFDLSDAINHIRAGLVARRFDGVSEKSILRNIAASFERGIGDDDMDALRDRTSAELKNAAEVTAGAYMRAVDFLFTDVGVKSYAYLPYALQITFLAELFRLCPTPMPNQRAVLRRWFWQSSFGGYYQGANTLFCCRNVL